MHCIAESWKTRWPPQITETQRTLYCPSPNRSSTWWTKRTFSHFESRDSPKAVHHTITSFRTWKLQRTSRHFLQLSVFYKLQLHVVSGGPAGRDLPYSLRSKTEIDWHVESVLKEHDPRSHMDYVAQLGLHAHRKCINSTQAHSAISQKGQRRPCMFLLWHDHRVVIEHTSDLLADPTQSGPWALYQVSAFVPSISRCTRVSRYLVYPFRPSFFFRMDLFFFSVAMHFLPKVHKK